jgi:hypothetical protein
MTSLVKKNLVSKDNKLPAKYRLTEDGRNLANTMLHGSKENSVPINQSGKIANKIPKFSRVRVFLILGIFMRGTFINF